jgi:hypothetical protein
MKRIASGARPTGMTNQGRVRGLVAAGLLCAALAGCGTAVASTSPATAPQAPRGGGAPLAAPHQTGCAGENQATSVIIRRALQVTEPVNGGTRTVTQRHATLVRRLFRDICAAVATAGRPQPGFACAAAESGFSYAGTFYDRQRVLATFSYDTTGCPRLSLTASGKTRVTLLIGRAAAAAPHFRADLAAVLGLPQSQV